MGSCSTTPPPKREVGVGRGGRVARGVPVCCARHVCVIGRTVLSGLKTCESALSAKKKQPNSSKISTSKPMTRSCAICARGGAGGLKSGGAYTALTRLLRRHRARRRPLRQYPPRHRRSRLPDRLPLPANNRLRLSRRSARSAARLLLVAS